MKEKSGAPLEYGDDVDLNLDIYRESWPLAKYMTWYIPASVRDAEGVSIGDGDFEMRQWSDLNETIEILPITYAADDDDSHASNITHQSGQSNFSHRSNQSNRSKSRCNDLESTFANVATSLTSFIQKQSERIETPTAPSEQNKLKYAQMYEELDKALAKVSFLDAVKFLTTTIENANLQFNKDASM